MTALEFSAIFGLGVVSSLHCVQMCGPLVLAYSLPLAAQPRSRRLLYAHAGYNLGRIWTYSALGALAGGAGGVVSKLTAAAGTLRILAGIAMLIAAVLIAGLYRRGQLVQIESGSPFARAIGRMLRAPSKLRLGLLAGFIPCGLIYAALLKAVESGSVLAGALTMVAFGMGTAGALMAIGMMSSAIGCRLSRWSSVLSAASVAAMGIFLLWRGLAGEHTGHVHHG
jgi:sulfite exporter TauE/SafE